ncbi:MAG: ATP synthase F0 subunit B [Saprospiraceae bacterium]|nr:ATP synthase F0 subunit B [Saprospiraceae bacterium]
MFFLVEFSVLNPSFGLIFWTSLIFILVWVFLSRFFKNIAEALENRENFIDGSLTKAKKAEAALAGLESEKEAMLKEAEQKGLEIIREAEAIKKTKIAQGEARGKEREKNILEAAELDKANRMKEMELNIQNQIGQSSLEIAKKLLQRELEGNHEDFVKAQIAELQDQELVA